MKVELNRDQLPLVMNVLAAVIMAGVLAFQWVLPAPNANKAVAQTRRNAQIAKVDTARAKRENEQRAAVARALTFSEGPEQIGPRALATVSRIAREEGVKIVSFRPQRVKEGEDLIEVPFLAALEGGYPSILSLLRKLERRENRLAVTLIQIAAADAATSRVNANLGLSAFQIPPEVPSGRR